MLDYSQALFVFTSNYRETFPILHFFWCVYSVEELGFRLYQLPNILITLHVVQSSLIMNELVILAVL